MNFVKTKIELATLKSGDTLEILLDDGEPIENVPGSIKSEGHKVLDQKKIDNYWIVIIEKV
jgi:sulfite reductase (ferredoxin)